MANNIERLNYYEREYLRSFDFVAEQNYHLEMRRRVNLALHLWGIVDGLDVKLGEVVPGVPDQYYITPGMAIDAYGREIFLFANYALSEDDLDTSRIRTGGRYSLFIAYSRESTTPPSPGFGVCDIKDQYTRQRESFSIVISDEADPTNEPTEISELSDDPKKKPWLVRLGTVIVGQDPVTKKAMIVSAAPESRVYIGLRAERVVTPADATKNFEVLKANTALLPATSLGVQANLFAEQNAIVGVDFVVSPNNIFPPPKPVAPAVFPNLTGNLKIANDLFLQGNFYANVGNKWLSLGEQIQALTPEILVGLHPITIPSPNFTDPGNGTEKFTVPTSRLKKVGSAQVAASIASVRWNDLQTRVEIFFELGSAAKVSYEITSATASRGQTSPNSCDVEIAWKVAPTAQFNLVGPPASTEFRSAIIGLTFAYMIVCNP